MIPIPQPSQPIAVNALSDALSGVKVSTQMPNTRPARHVIVSRIGGGDGDFGTVTPRFLIECYAPNELDAETFAEQVRHAWNHLRTHGINAATDDNNLALNPSPDENHVRFQFTGTLQIFLQNA